MGIPLGVFGGISADDGDVSVSYNIEKDLLELFEQLIQRKRRRVLVLSLPSYGSGNDLIRDALEKVSGQFVSQKYSEYFADIRTYIETCYRNGVNCFKALSRLTAGNPYTLEELSGEA